MKTWLFLIGLLLAATTAAAATSSINLYRIPPTQLGKALESVCGPAMSQGACKGYVLTLQGDTLTLSGSAPRVLGNKLASVLAEIVK